MDADRFDVVVRSFAAVSRRATLGRMAGGLAALIGLLGAEDVAAGKKRRKKNKKCKGGQKKCGKRCIPKANCCTDANCGECEHCQSGTCIPGCQSGQICQNGACTCPTGQRDCQGTCIPDGDCCANVDCASGAACVDGACLCLNGFRPCQELCIPDEDCCNDDDCPDVAACQEGVCVCPVDGQVACAESCVNLSTNGGNCGACGVACASDHSCVHGACTCVGGADCPEECSCGVRLEGGFACLGGGGQLPRCDGDGDCPLGSFCLNVGFCSKPCLP